MRSSDVSIVVTGVDWMGSGIGSIETALEQLFREAQHEIILTAYAVSSGANLVFDLMYSALARGVIVHFMINRMDTQPSEVIARLRQYIASYQHFNLYDFVAEDEVDLHAKAVVADRRIAVVSSSNLSWRGISANYEMAVRIEGTGAEKVASALDALLHSRFTKHMTR